MFSRILVACRGEIALRIIRTCREMGIETVAVYSEADSNSAHLRLADAAVCIGAPTPASSYLNIPAIISAAEISDVEAIHPGYGFLAENAHFVDVCRSCQIEFVGPTSKAISQMGDKVEAKRIAKSCGVPVVPGSDGPVEDEKSALKIAHEIGYPVLLKPSAGGGGRGMRIAHNDISLVNALMASRAEAEISFADSSVYIEKYIENPKHVEVQILADNYGNILTLGERDCSIMRRYQKLLEESPSPGIDDELRKKLMDSAIQLVRAVEYTSAGTIEYVIDDNNNYFFIEMNTRIQVEHPVTEFVTGVDIVKQQILVADGNPLSVSQEDVKIKGHSIECRINAEDPADNFKPHPGNVGIYLPPVGEDVRVDTHIYGHYEMPQYYDSLLAKVITHGKDRTEAMAKMERALEDMVLEGLPTTIDFHLDVLRNKHFQEGKYNTGFVEHVLYK